MERKSGGSFKETETLAQIKICVEKFSLLKKRDIFSRRNALKEIQKILLTCEEFNWTNDCLNDVLDRVIKLIISTINDENEKCREISIAILIFILDHLNKIEVIISPVISMLALRLGNSDEREPSEEVRLLEIHFLCKLLEKYEGNLLKHLTEVSNILCACIVDDCPEIKRKSCECTSILAIKQQVNFHMISSTLVKPLLKTLYHQHFKTRTVCIYAIGSVFCCGSSQDFEQVLTHLAQKLFDHSPAVRSAVTEVVGKWLVEFADRYSYFHHLVPLMLSSLYDEVLGIRSRAESLWNEAGFQYLQENEKDYKDFIDFPKPKPDNYPLTGNRPSLGCRILVQRNIFSILPALLNDLTDWAPETRVKSSKVLYSLILHTEDKATMQLPSFIQGIITAARDEEKEPVEQAIRSAELLGFFIDTRLLCDNIMTLIYKSPTAVHLSIFAAILRGCKKSLTCECFHEICKVLSNPMVARVRQADEQANLLLCIESLLSTQNKIDSISAYQIFTVLTSVSGLADSNLIPEKACGLVEKLASQSCTCSSQPCSCSSIYNQCALSFLKVLIVNNELWTSQSPEMSIFYFVVQSDHVTKEVIKLAVPVMTNNLHLSKDAKLRSHIFSLLLKVFKSFSSKAEYEALTDEILVLIHKGIFPNLNWAPGKTASALRTVAAASLYEIVCKNCITKDMMKSVSDELLPILVNLSDDDDVSNRLLSCKILEIILPVVNTCIDEHKIHTACYDILHCMDDESDEIRIMTIRVLESYIKSFPENYCWSSYQSHLKHMYENVLIHIDDKNEKVRQSVFSFLKEVAYAAPEVLLKEVESKKFVMTATDFCDSLIEHIKNLNV